MLILIFSILVIVYYYFAKASYDDYIKLKNENKGNILGQYIESLSGYPADSLEYQALCEGVQALMETRRG